MKPRKVTIRRFTRETQIRLSLNLDGKGRYKIDSSIPFLDHMLELFAKHGGFDLAVQARGDRHVDDHHLVEDLGIVLGQAVQRALGGKKGIARYGNFLLPMDEALSYVCLDLGGRAYLIYKVKFPQGHYGGTFDLTLLKHFFEAFSENAKMNLHITLQSGENPHHIAESIFKGVAKALSQAVERRRGRGIPSTKGRL